MNNHKSIIIRKDIYNRLKEKTNNLGGQDKNKISFSDVIEMSLNEQDYLHNIQPCFEGIDVLEEFQDILIPISGRIRLTKNAGQELRIFVKG